MRSLRVFRDQSSLAANPALWPSIQHALDRSEAFILQACPQAGRSPWVRREIEHWLHSHGSPDRFLIVLTGGTLTQVVYASDGEALASGDRDRLVALWQLPSRLGEEVFRHGDRARIQPESSRIRRQ